MIIGFSLVFNQGSGILRSIFDMTREENLAKLHDFSEIIKNAIASEASVQDNPIIIKIKKYSLEQNKNNTLERRN